MKKITLSVLLFLSIFFFSCSSLSHNYHKMNNLQSVRYLQTSVSGSTASTVILTDGSRWELDRRPYVNAGENATVIIFMNHPGGFFITKNMTYRILPKINEAFDKGYNSFFNDGLLGSVKEINLKERSVTVSGNKKFIVPSDYVSGLAAFKVGDKILLNENSSAIEDLNLQIQIPCKEKSE